MELPFLNKKSKNPGGVMVAQVSDGKSDDQMMDMVAKEFMDAIEKKDVRGLRDALAALVMHIGDMDDMQDGEMER